jgi:hypothetical protein
MKKTILLLFSSILFSSCVSRLKVIVETADRDKILEEYQKKETLPNLLALENFTTTWDKTNVLNEIYTSLQKPNQKGKSSILLDGAKEIIAQNFDEKIEPFIVKIKDLVSRSRTAYEQNKLADSSELNNEASYNIQKIYTILKEYDTGRPEDKKVSLIDSNGNLSNISSSIINGKPRTKFPILGDPLASYITKKENKIWKSIFNKTASWNVLGNADVAVILRSTPPDNEEKSGDYNNNFTVKGVRLDAADATDAILTSMVQTVNFIANTSGMPLKNTGADTDNKVPTPDVTISELPENILKLESKKRRLLEYRRMIIDKIKLENLDDPTKSSEELKASSKRIEDYWIKIKTELIK